MREINPTPQNEKVLSDYLAIKIKKGLKEKYPTAEEVVEDLK